MTSKPSLRIRRGLPDDTKALTAFNIRMARETESKVLAPARVNAGVRRVLTDPGLGFYVVAQSAAEVVGALMITYEWSDWRNGFFWWIQSVYVNPEYRGQGVYRRLYGFVQCAAAEDDVCGIRLYVEKNNTHAQAVYRHLGMTLTHYDVYGVEFPP